MEKFKHQFSGQREIRNIDIRYNLAMEKVKRIEGFYNHLLAYIIFNTIIILTNNHGKIGTSEFWSFQTFSVAFFWGIGLLAHWISVFGQHFIVSRNWEERKIKQLMEKEKERI